MRIGVVTDLWPPFPGGAERFIFNISRELKNRGHEIFVLTSYANAAEFDGIKPTWKSVGCHQYDNDPGHTHADGWRDISEFLYQSRVDVVLTHHFFAHEFRQEFFEDGEIPVVQLVHNGTRNPKAAIAIFNSDFTRARGAAMPGDFTIIPPAFDDCRAATHDSYIGFIKPIQHKGVDFMYKLAAHCSNRNFMVLHGEWQVHEDIRRGLPNIFFMPPVHEMKTYYEKVCMMIVPSINEDAGTVPQEAAVNGIPCISTNVMGLAQTNRGGIILAPNNVSVWAAEIDRLYNSQDYYRSVVQRQNEYIAGLNWPRQFDELSEKICLLSTTR
jgi:glycosyltransferase involved in cell wall biosynthesis